MPSPAMAFGQLQLGHLGPVSRRDRVLRVMERITPYLTSVLVMAVLILIPALLLTTSKVRKTFLPLTIIFMLELQIYSLDTELLQLRRNCKCWTLETLLSVMTAT